MNKFSTLYTEEEIQIKAEYIIETREKEHDDIRSCLNATTTNSVWNIKNRKKRIWKNNNLKEKKKKNYACVNYAHMCVYSNKQASNINRI